MHKKVTGSVSLRSVFLLLHHSSRSSWLKRWPTMITTKAPSMPSALKAKNPAKYDPVVSKRIPTRSGPSKAVIPKKKLSSPWVRV